MDLQSIADDVQEHISMLQEVEQKAEDKIAIFEDIKERAAEVSDTLEADLAVLDRIAENTKEAEAIVTDAEQESIV